jgi:hypothetical protein
MSCECCLLLLFCCAGEEGSDSATPAQLTIVDSASKQVIGTFRPGQRVWVRLSADGSRAHGPRMRMRLLADQHPEAVAAAQQEAVDAAAAARKQQQGKGAAGADAAATATDGGLPRKGAQAYRPPGLGPAARGGFAGAVAQLGAAARGPPPGFGPQTEPTTVAGGDAATHDSLELGGAPQAASAKHRTAGTEPRSLAAQLDTFLEQQLGEQAGAGASPLAWQASLPAFELLPSSHDGTDDSDVSASAERRQLALQQAMRRLEAHAARLQLRAAAATPGKEGAMACAAAAAGMRQHILELQQHLVPG